jgi:outer membrane lipoprotein SlyB
MRSRTLSTSVLLCTLALLTACAVPIRREERVVYVPARVPVYSELGRVERIGYVQVAARGTGGGALLGAVIGGVVGSRFGGGSGQVLATGVGAIGGAMVGEATEARQRRDDEVYRVQIRFDGGAVREFDFQRIDDLRVGDRVKLENGQLHRV